jgi:hypothetical protein
MSFRWRKIKRKVLGFVSFSAALFIFQACYGAPQDTQSDIIVQGTVKSDSTGQTVEGIKVTFTETNQYVITDSSGSFYFYIPEYNSYPLRFEDNDSIENGSFNTFDTIISGTPSAPIEIILTQTP